MSDNNKLKGVDLSKILIALFFLVIFYLFSTMSTDKWILLLQELKDPSSARGMITFSITMASIFFCFILIFQALTGEYEEKHLEKRFKFAREVVSGLMGILGTIVGFYFGSSIVDTTPDLELAEVVIYQDAQGNAQLVSHAHGGKPPYYYSIDENIDGVLEAESKPTENGWIRDRVSTSTMQLKLQVIDRNDNRAYRIWKITPLGYDELKRVKNKESGYSFFGEFGEDSKKKKP